MSINSLIIQEQTFGFFNNPISNNENNAYTVLESQPDNFRKIKTSYNTCFILLSISGFFILADTTLSFISGISKEFLYYRNEDGVQTWVAEEVFVNTQSLLGLILGLFLGCTTIISVMITRIHKEGLGKILKYVNNFTTWALAVVFSVFSMICILNTDESSIICNDCWPSGDLATQAYWNQFWNLLEECNLNILCNPNGWDWLGVSYGFYHNYGVVVASMIITATFPIFAYLSKVAIQNDIPGLLGTVRSNDGNIGLFSSVGSYLISMILVATAYVLWFLII